MKVYIRAIDPGIPSIIWARQETELYNHLAEQMMNVNEQSHTVRYNLDRVGLLVARAHRELLLHEEANRISHAERLALAALLTDGLKRDQCNPALVPECGTRGEDAARGVPTCVSFAFDAESYS